MIKTDFDNFLKKNFPNFYYHEVVFAKMFKLCKRCKLTYSKKELKNGICAGCEALPVIKNTREKVLFVIASLFSFIVVLVVLIVIR